MKKSLTIEDLKSRIGKPIFVIALKNDYKKKNSWYVLEKINEFKAEDENAGYIEFTDCNYIDFKNAEDFRLFDTEVSESELQEILKENEKTKSKTGYETVAKGEDYFFVASNTKSVIKYAYTTSDSYDVDLEICGNHFNDKTLATNIARAERLRYQLRRFAALNGGISSAAEWFSYSSWEDGSNWKYSIQYNYGNQKMQINCTLTNKCFGQIYFKSEEACKKAVETFKEELIWYFTEFEEMLY